MQTLLLLSALVAVLSVGMFVLFEIAVARTGTVHVGLPYAARAAVMTLGATLNSADRSSSTFALANPSTALSFSDGYLDGWKSPAKSQAQVSKPSTIRRRIN